MPSHTPFKPSYRPEIDGLRALAVIAVIINHFNKEILPSGYLGVDIFFVISGYVITSSLAKRQHSSLNEFLLGFYSRRVKRLVPALIFCIVVTSFLGLLFIVPESVMLSLKTGLTSLFGLSNIYLYRQSTDYFGASAELNLFTQTWSLGVEEQFYFLFPILVWISGFSRPQKPQGSHNLFLWVGSLSLLSVIAYVYLNGVNQPAAYFLMPSRFWEMGIGCLLFLLLQNSPKIASLLAQIPPFILIVLTVAVFFTPLFYQVPATLAVVTLTVCLIASLSPGTPIYQGLTLKPVIFIGLISYSLYLWHWTVLTISRWTIGIHWWSIPFQLGLMVLLAILSCFYIERPLRHHQWSHLKVLDITYALLSSLSSVGLLVFIGNFGNRLYLGKENPDNALFQTVESQFIANASEDVDLLRGLEEARQKKYDCHMTPHHLTGKDFRPKPEVDPAFIDQCLQSDKKKIILVGDSFARVMGEHIALAALTLDYDFTMIAGYGCPYPMDIKSLPLRYKNTCEIDPQMLVNTIEDNLKAGDILVVRLYFPKYFDVNVSRTFGQSMVSIYDDAILELYQKVQKQGASLLIIGSNAIAEVHPGCLYPEWFNSLQRKNLDCETIHLEESPLSRFSLHHGEYLSQQLATKYDRLSVLAPMPDLCDQDRNSCSLIETGTHLMEDSEHLTGAAIDKFYPKLLSELQSLASQSQ